MGLLTALHLRRPNPWERPTALDIFLDAPLPWLMTRIFHLILLLRGRPFLPPPNRPPIRVVCLSDTHDLRPEHVPDGDLLVHAGDLTNDGTRAAIQSQLDWLAGLPHGHKVVIAGNHDGWFDPAARKVVEKGERQRRGRGRERDGEEVNGDGVKDGEGGELDFKGIQYLENRLVTLTFKDGRRLNVFGAPALPVCGGSNFAFQYPRHQPPWKGAIPDETDVLVTHTPPRYHRDLNLGCAGLLEEVWRVKPKLHIFGHVHWGAGRESAFFDDCQRAYESLMARPRRGLLYDLFPNPGWVDAFWLLWHGLNSVLWKWLMQGPGTNQGGLMVNAAVMHGNTGRLGKEVQVVDL